MAQYGFGSGLMWATPTSDAFGNTIANPTPLLFGVLQEGSLDISAETKMLHGQLQFPVAVARGKAKVSGTAKVGQIFAAMFNGVFFGQTLTQGLVSAQYDTVGALVPSTPFTITVTPPNSGTFSRNLGVIDSNGVPLIRVASAPAAGQYSLAGAVYTFNTAQQGQRVFINYEFTNTNTNAPGSFRQVVQNLPMGAAPAFAVDLFMPYQGDTLKVQLFNAIASKLTLSTKQDDFMIPEFAFDGFANGAGQVLEWSTTE